MGNNYNLERFLRPQEKMYDTAYRELKGGKKRTHWMWYIFPQIRGLARSRKAFVFGIKDIDEAKVYIAHPLLGPRLAECCEAVLQHTGRPPEDIFGEVDAIKLRSSMTLFALVSGELSVFHKVLQCFFGGEMDQNTVGLISGKIIDATCVKYAQAFIN